MDTPGTLKLPPRKDDLTPKELKEENERLRELVVDLSRIIARSVLDDEKK